MHDQAAIDQRQAIKHFTLKYMNSLDLPLQPVHLPDFIDSGSDGEEEEESIHKILEAADQRADLP
eukprot:10237563-Ditylum_brightwellii.AAC.1